MRSLHHPPRNTLSRRDKYVASKDVRGPKSSTIPPSSEVMELVKLIELDRYQPSIKVYRTEDTFGVLLLSQPDFTTRDQHNLNVYFAYKWLRYSRIPVQCIEVPSTLFHRNFQELSRIVAEMGGNIQARPAFLDREDGDEGEGEDDWTPDEEREEPEEDA